MTDLPAKQPEIAVVARKPPTTLEILDRRIAAAESPHELALLVSARREVLRQDEEAAENRHRRETERRAQIATVALSVAALGTGVGLIATGHVIEGRMALGAGLWFVAPDLMRTIFGVRRRGGNDASA